MTKVLLSSMFFLVAGVTLASTSNGTDHEHQPLQLVQCVHMGRVYPTWHRLPVDGQTLECRPDGQWYRVA